MRTRRAFEILDTEEIERIHLATLKVLDKTGVVFQEPRALEIFDESGAVVDFKKQRVWIPPYLVEEAVRKAPGRFTWHARNPRYDLNLEPGNAYFNVGGSCPYILDVDTGQRRLGTLKDAADVYRLTSALERAHACAESIVPSDLPMEPAGIAKELLVNIQNCEKPVFGGYCPFGAKHAAIYARMCAVLAGGFEELRRKPYIVGWSNPVSPLQHAQKLTEAVLEYTKYGLPVHFGPEAMAGATAPVTLAGLLVQQNAEVLSGITLVELVNPGNPVLYGTVSAPIDMKTGNISLGGIEVGLINMATAQLARYYRIPVRGIGGTTDSKVPDPQAAYEGALTAYMAAIGGVNLIVDALGPIESTLTFSPVQMVVNCEMLGMVERALRGIEVDHERLAVDVIDKVGPGKNYLVTEHTREYFREEVFLPSLSDKSRREEWERSGAKDIVHAAKEKVKKILREYEPEPLDKDIEKQLKEIVEELKKEHW